VHEQEENRCEECATTPHERTRVKVIVPQRILFVKLCCIGDVIFMTPAIQTVHNAFPNARIGFLASSFVKDVVERIPHVDEIINYDVPYKWTKVLSNSCKHNQSNKNIKTK